MGQSLLAAPATLGELINLLTQIVIFGTPFAILLALFFWNLYQLIMTVGDAEKKKQARDRIVFGVLILFVVFSLAGLVAVLQGTLFGQDAVSRSFRLAPAPTNSAPSEPPVDRPVDRPTTDCDLGSPTPQPGCGE